MVLEDSSVAAVVAVKIEERTARRSALAFSTTWEFRRDDDTELVEKADALPVVMARARASDVTLIVLRSLLLSNATIQSIRIYGHSVWQSLEQLRVRLCCCAAGKSRGGSKFDFASS